jgi:hypothetical protein
MTDQHTRLDHAHAAMAETDSDADRAGFYARVAETELMLLLEVEADGDQIIPQVFPVEGDSFVLVFDTEERLSEFVGGTAPYAAVSGKTIVEMLTGQGVGLGINLGVAPSETLLPADAVDWLHAQLHTKPAEAEDKPQDISQPNLPEQIIIAIDRKLAGATGLAQMAYLVAVTYESGARGHLLAIINALEGAEGALSQAMAEALHFADVEAAALDVAFFDSTDAMAATLAKHGLRFDIPQHDVATAPAAPGSDPAKPPRLR